MLAGFKKNRAFTATDFDQRTVNGEKKRRLYQCVGHDLDRFQNIFSPSTIYHAKVFSKDLPEAGSVTTSVRKTQDLEWEGENNIKRNKHKIWLMHFLRTSQKCDMV